MTAENSQKPDQRLAEEQIDALGHILVAGAAGPNDPGYNGQIDVFSKAYEGDKAQVYQMWAVDAIASNPIAAEAFKDFGLSGDNQEKTKWTQLLEHIAGVDAIAQHLESLLEKHGASSIDRNSLQAVAVYDSIHKPLAIAAGEEQALETAVLVHDLEKPAELSAGAGGLENSRDNPVLREGRLWDYLRNKGVSDDILMAAQNTGRTDRFFGELDEYSDSAVKKALEDRESLARLLNVDRDIVDAMSPQERRRSSIEAKGRLAAVVAIADALAAQFRFQGMSDASIDAMSAHYLTYKKDPESVAFFSKDWPEYYKEVRKYLVSLVPPENQAALAADFENLTQQDIYNETVLPNVLGETTKQRSEQQRAHGESNVYDQLRY